MNSNKAPKLVKDALGVLQDALDDNPTSSDYSGVWPVTIRDTYGKETGHADPHESSEGLVDGIERAVALLSDHEALSEDQRRLALIMTDVVRICQECNAILPDRIATLVEEADSLV